MTGAEMAARITAARAVAADFRREARAFIYAGDPAAPSPDYSIWAFRLLASVQSLADGAGLDAPVPACGTCGTADQPMTVDIIITAATGARRQLHRCKDIRACNDRRFPELAAMLAQPGPADLPDGGSEPAPGAGAETGQLAWIRAILAAFDWESGNRQLALEAIGRIADGPGAEPGVLGQVLADAIAHREPSGRCADCDSHPAGLCEDHAADLDRTDAYLALARELGIEVDR